MRATTKLISPVWPVLLFTKGKVKATRFFDVGSEFSGQTEWMPTRLIKIFTGCTCH